MRGVDFVIQCANQGQRRDTSADSVCVDEIDSRENEEKKKYEGAWKV